MPRKPHPLQRSPVQIALLALCLAAGWTLSHLSPQLSAQGLMERILRAQQTLYYAKIGAPGEPMQYYVYARDFTGLEARAADDPDIVAFEKTRLPRLATVTLSSAAREPYERLKTIAGVESVVRVPDFCH